VTPLLALAVIVTGAVAAVVRYLVGLALAARPGFPWAVLAVNVVGSALGGVVLGLAERAAISGDIRLVLLTGLCGGLTTFSTFGVETVELVRAGRTRAALASVAGNLVLGIGAAALGYVLTR
jgi:CrcB protein